MSSKLGRKGDPRMHKAVAARLANPNLSLYEALCIGGFDYSENDDKSVTDSKKVTLGQRKNQLSRRLRLARKQGSASSTTSRVASNGINEVLYNDTTIHRNGTNGVPTTKNEQAGKNLIDNPNDGIPAHGQYRSKMDIINELGTTSYNNNPNGRNGKAMGAQQPKRQRFTKCLNSTTFERTCTMNPGTHYIHQGWQLGNFPPHMGGDGTSGAMLASGPMLGSTQATNYPSPQYYTPQIANRIPDQNVPRYQHGSVALSSLATTAQAVGLSLDQLALTLSSNTTSLSKLVAEVRSGDSEIKREQMALDLYQSDVKGLYTKCLLMAGVDTSLAEQNTPTYIKFATKAWEAEGKRLRSLQDAMNGKEEVKSATASQKTPETKTQETKDGEKNESAVVSSDSDAYSQNRNQNPDPNRSDADNSANDGKPVGKQEKVKCDARHMHRLGECGHNAIIHRPKDGTPHIDFIVNDQIECYSGQDTTSLAGRSFDMTWPSKFKCNELEECNGKGCGKNVANELDPNWGNMDSLVQEPKIFKLSEIDTDDPEWTFDSNEDAEGGVGGLFKLGRETSGEIANT